MSRNRTRRGFWWSSTGKKFLMAFSGAVLFGFIVGHLAGNLQVFLGPEAINRYAAFLKSTGELLWVARSGLLIMVVLHIVTAISLTGENWAARPVGYHAKRYVRASYASRTMHVSGFIVLAYLVYHLMHFTWLTVHPEYKDFFDPQGRHDVYRMIVTSFQNPAVAGAYMVANFLLGMHLSHGIYSALQSLGIVGQTVRRWIQGLAHLIGYGIALGYMSIPAAIWWGIVK